MKKLKRIFLSSLFISISSIASFTSSSSSLASDFSITSLLIVALGGVFTERGGVTNIALDGIMIMGAFTSIFFINQMQDKISGQLLLILAILISIITGMIFSLLLAYSAINMKADQIIGGTALNMFAPAFAIYVARMIQELFY